MALPIALPTTPLAIELSIRHRRRWWEPAGRGTVQRWRMSADVSQLIPCGEVFRHVADLEVDLIDLRRRAGADEHGDWARQVADECVVDHSAGRLLQELEERIGPGVPRAVVLRSIVVSEPWRGQRLAELLLASALRFWSRSARVALCRVQSADFAADCADPVAAELAALRMAGLLARLGFFSWREVYVADPASPVLRDVRDSVIQLWWPGPGHSYI